MRSIFALLVVGALLLSGCAPETPAVTVHTFAGTLEKQQVVKGTVDERTGDAIVELDGGTRVIAKCPFPDLDPGARVVMQQNADGSWVVMGKE